MALRHGYRGRDDVAADKVLAPCLQLSHRITVRKDHALEKVDLDLPLSDVAEAALSMRRHRGESERPERLERAVPETGSVGPPHFRISEEFDFHPHHLLLALAVESIDSS